jgi:hypothetical protein
MMVSDTASVLGTRPRIQTVSDTALTRRAVSDTVGTSQPTWKATAVSDTYAK